MNLSSLVVKSGDNTSIITLGTQPAQTTFSFVQDIVILILYGFVTVLGLFGNSIVCYVVLRKKIVTTTYVLIGNLAVSDILGSISIPGQWLFCSYHMLEEYGDRMCGLTKTSQMLSYYISTFTMTVIAFDRFRIVYYPMAERMKPWIPIVCIWLLATICVLPTMVSMRIMTYFSPNHLIHCRIAFPSTYFSKGPFRKFRAAFVMITQYAIPLIIAIILYAFCIIKIISRKRLGAVTDQQSREFCRSKRRTIQMLTIALLAFAIAWLPVHLIHMIDFYITPLLPNDCNFSPYYLFVYWLAVSSVCFNPFIYCYLNNDFRSAAKSVLMCRFGRREVAGSRVLLQSKSSRQNSNTSSSIFYVNVNEWMV